MSYVLLREYGESSYKITVKKRKTEIMLLEEEVHESFLLASYIESELPEPNKVVVFMIRLEISEEEEEDIWEIDKDVTITLYDNFTEIILPVDTFWSDAFLDYGIRKKWFKYKLYKLEVRNEDGRGRPKYKRVNSFTTELLKWLGVPTEDEWLERKRDKKITRRK